MNKKQLRRKYLRIRKAITDREEKNSRICSFLMEWMADRYEVVGIYASFGSEADTCDIILKLLDKGVRVAVSRTYPDHLVFYEISSLDELTEENPFGYREPQEVHCFEKEDIDLMIVPGIGFDRQFNRLGFGKGYYDRYLADYAGDICAICFEEQIMEETIETDEHDIKIPVIITDKKIRVMDH